jgi:L-galactono-1,4-lactone dehydrogenase
MEVLCRHSMRRAIARAVALVSVPLAAARAEERTEQIVNWSGTHSVTAREVFMPSSRAEVAEIVRSHAREGAKLRPIGSSISPNGIGLPEEGGDAINLALMSRLLAVNVEGRTCTVEAGARVSDVVRMLEPYGLTLENYASIAEQQIGGFTQAGAHGTGARIPPVDDQVVALEMSIPGEEGRLLTIDERTPELLRLARQSLGLLGVVTRVTLRVVPRHVLRERTWTITRDEAFDADLHARRLRSHRHVRYMWIPYTDTVVVVASDPVFVDARAVGGEGLVPVSGLGDGRDGDGTEFEAEGDPADESTALEPLCLLAESLGAPIPEPRTVASIRDAVLSLDPLDLALVKQVNAAEAEYWRRTSGRVRQGWSDAILGFDCGGAQWVSEVAFPTGSIVEPTGSDLAFMRELLEGTVEGAGVCAHSPIEQRWTAATLSPLSPASAQRHPQGEAGVFSWVGIIQYVPRPDLRGRVTKYFHEHFEGSWRAQLWAKYDAVPHWAKLEAGSEPFAATQLRHLKLVRGDLDPKGITDSARLNASA